MTWWKPWNIDKPTYMLGNTLDLIYTESLNRVRVPHSFIDNFISNHRVLGIELEIKKQLEKHKSTKHRNYKDFSLNSFSQKFNNNKILDQSSWRMQYKCSMKRWKNTRHNSLTRRKKETKETKQTMVYQSTTQTKKNCQKQGRAYITYRENHQWKAFTREWNRYNRMLDYNKRHQ